MEVKDYHKAVILSIQPHWCKSIVDGKKTLEVRKSKPKLSVPFTCYIYCTKHSKSKFEDSIDEKSRGMIIGEFECDRINEEVLFNSFLYDSMTLSTDESLLSLEEVKAYLGVYHKEFAKKYKFYSWHISNLHVYKKPIALQDVRTKGGNNKTLLMPPQSWCYVE